MESGWRINVGQMSQCWIKDLIGCTSLEAFRRNKIESEEQVEGILINLTASVTVCRAHVFVGARPSLSFPGQWRFQEPRLLCWHQRFTRHTGMSIESINNPHVSIQHVMPKAITQYMKWYRVRRTKVSLDGSIHPQETEVWLKTFSSGGFPPHPQPNKLHS